MIDLLLTDLKVLMKPTRLGVRVDFPVQKQSEEIKSHGGQEGFTWTYRALGIVMNEVKPLGMNDCEAM